MSEWINEFNGGVEIRLRVVPRASKNEISGLHGGILKVRLTSPPVDGKANKALIQLMSKTLNIPKTQIELIHGETSRLKTLRLSGITNQQVCSKINL